MEENEKQRQSTVISFAKMEKRERVKLVKLSEREDALPPVNWSPSRPEPV